MRRERIERAAEESGELVWLLGQPHLSDYLDFVKAKTVGGDAVPPARLVEEWRAANDLYYDLAQAEAGLCETIDARPLPPALAPLEAELRAHPWFASSFNDLPNQVAMVELDKLIVTQTHVERGPHDAAAAALGDDAEALFRFCQPVGRALPPVRVQRLGEGRWLFSSMSTDLRERDAVMLRGAALRAAGVEGPVAALVGVPVGFGSNLMSAVRSGRRIALQNGYHRAVALRAAGFTHAPCVIEEVTRKDELRVGGDEELNADPEFYFAAPRPPMLKDFFDSRIAKSLTVRRIETCIEVEVKVRSGTATDL